MANNHSVHDLSGEVEILSYRPVFSGPYSNVYRGKLKESNQLVAVKVINAIYGASVPTMRRRIERERRAWSGMQHPNILPMLGFANDDDLFQPFGAFVSPWCKFGDLGQYLREHGASSPLEERLIFWSGIVAGVAYLHNQNPVLVHGDLKPRNILIDDSGNAQICDFGLVRVFMEQGHSGMTTTSAHTGTDRYLAYELVVSAGHAVPTAASDIYATGCIGLEVLFLQTPYSHRGDNLRWHILNDMKAGMLPGRRPNDLSSHQNAIWDIISQCWDPDPLSRPRADGLNIPSTFIKPFTKRSTIRFFLSAKTMKSEKMEKQGDNHVASSNVLPETLVGNVVPSVQSTSDTSNLSQQRYDPSLRLTNVQGGNLWRPSLHKRPGFSTLDPPYPIATKSTPNHQNASPLRRNYAFSNIRELDLSLSCVDPSQLPSLRSEHSRVSSKLVTV